MNLHVMLLKILICVSCSFVIRSVKIDPSEGFLKTGKWPTLSVLSAGHALHVFVNGQLAGVLHIFSFERSFNNFFLSKEKRRHYNCFNSFNILCRKMKF